MLYKFLFDNEPLELDLSKQINNSSSKFNALMRAILIKIYRKSYKFFQRLFLRPSLRRKFSSIEKIIFKKNYIVDDSIIFDNVSKIKSKSFVKIDNVFSNNDITKIKSQFTSSKIFLDPIYGDYQKFKITDKNIKAHTGYIPTEHIFKNELIIKGALNEKLLNTLKLYFNSSFKLDWIWCWWSIPNEKSLGPQLFHRDYESMNFLKFFVYLTDVNENNGPHQIISGSHEQDNFYKRERFNDFDINKKYKNEINTINGSSGTNFLANTFSIHRGLLPKQKRRLVLVYLFSVIPSNRCPKIPFMNVKDIQDENLKNKLIKNRNIFDQIYSF